MSGVINEFATWWGEGLASCVPKRLKTPRKQRLPAYLLVTPSAGGFELEYVAGKTSNDSGPRRLQISAESEHQSVRAWLADTLGSNAPVILRLPGDSVLRRRMSAPKVTPDKVRSMLEFEIDRQTPFSKDKVYFDFRLVNGNGEAEKLDLELGVVPRAVVDDLIERLARWDIHPQIVDSDDIRYDEHGFNLRGPDTGSGARNKKRSIVVYAALACAAIGALCSVPYYRTEMRINELQSIEKEVRAQAAEVAALKKTRDELDDQRRFIGELQTQGSDPLQIIDELTRLLPDDSWIMRFEMKDDNVTIQGESSSASSLIQLLQDSSLVDQPHFVSPITLNTASGKERFRISMSLVDGDPA